MKRFLYMFLFSLVAVNAYGAQAGRPAMSNRIITAPGRYTASPAQMKVMVSATNPVTTENTNAHSDGTEPTMVMATEKKDMREAERAACMNNNVGVGNTFVWASRYSNTSNYASMVEDVANPENNVCFVRVDLKSDDESRVSVSDIKPKYFMWGEEIECGGWADKNMLEKRILDAKKGNRIAGIVASSIGGAGLGVGIMETFGNAAIGHGLSGQKELSGYRLYKSQLLTLKEKGETEKYKRYVEYLKLIKKACEENGYVVDDFDCIGNKDLLIESTDL